MAAILYVQGFVKENPLTLATLVCLLVAVLMAGERVGSGLVTIVQHPFAVSMIFGGMMYVMGQVAHRLVINRYTTRAARISQAAQAAQVPSADSDSSDNNTDGTAEEEDDIAEKKETLWDKWDAAAAWGVPIPSRAQWARDRDKLAAVGRKGQASLYGGVAALGRGMKRAGYEGISALGRMGQGYSYGRPSHNSNVADGEDTDEEEDMQRQMQQRKQKELDEANENARLAGMLVGGDRDRDWSKYSNPKNPFILRVSPEEI